MQSPPTPRLPSGVACDSCHQMLDRDGTISLWGPVRPDEPAGLPAGERRRFCSACFTAFVDRVVDN